jgi:hypothetical protein
MQPSPIVPGHRPATVQQATSSKAVTPTPAPEQQQQQAQQQQAQQPQAPVMRALAHLPPEQRDLFMRVFGGAMILAGLVLAKFFVYDVMRAAEHGKEVAISVKLIVLIGILPTLGLIWLMLGQKAEQFMRPRGVGRQKMTPKQWLFTFVLIAPGLVLYFWMKARLAAMGYQF